MTAKEGVAQPHDAKELAKTIDFQRDRGEKAFNDGEQVAYIETIEMLENIRSHLIAVNLPHIREQDTRTESQKAADNTRLCVKIPSELPHLLLLKVAKTFMMRLKNQAAVKRAGARNLPQCTGCSKGLLQIAQRLEQIRNILTSKHTLSGDLAEVYSIREGGSYIRIYHSETEFVPTPISSSLIEPKPGKLPLVQFTAFHSRTVTTETWNTFLVYAHLESRIARDAS